MRTHGMSRTRFYKIYHGVWNRCNHTTCIPYEQYGALGVKSLWKSFEEFYEDMYTPYFELAEKIGERYVSIERKDPTGHYSKENCIWIHLHEQFRNKKKPMQMLEFNGKTQSITDWGNELGFKRDTIIGRLKHGWSVEKTLSTPLTIFTPRVGHRKRYPPKK